MNEFVYIYVCIFVYVCALASGVLLAVASKQNMWGMLDLQVEGGGYDSGLEAGCWQQEPITFLAEVI